MKNSSAATRTCVTARVRIGLMRSDSERPPPRVAVVREMEFYLSGRWCSKFDCNRMNVAKISFSLVLGEVENEVANGQRQWSVS